MGSIGDFFSGLVGGTTSASREQGRQQGNANAENVQVQGYQQEASAGRQKAGNTYDQVGQAGTQDRQLYTNNITQLLQQLAGTAGATAQPGANSSTVGAQQNNGQQRNPTQASTSPTAQQGAVTPPQGNDYGLTQAQQMQLNEQVAGIAQQAQQQKSQLASHFQSQGIAPGSEAYAVGMAQLDQLYNNQAQMAKANFAQAALQSKQQVLQFLTQTIQSIGGTGSNELTTAAGGQAGLAQGALGAAGVAQGSQQIAQSAANTAGAQAQSNSLMPFEIAGSILGGQFGGTPKPATGTATTVPVSAGSSYPLGNTLPGGVGYDPTTSGLGGAFSGLSSINPGLFAGVS